ncbi:tail fiber domain-containing protein [Flavobacterium magnum]|nr:tail fiber domain-containing protein [Flavobacterium magnum]
MKKQLFLLTLFACLLGAQRGHAQIGVGTETPQGALDVSATDKGLLVPRVVLTARNVAAPVTNPQGGALANGTLVYNLQQGGTPPNNVLVGFYFWQDGSWYPVSREALPIDGSAEFAPIYVSAYGNNTAAVWGAATTNTSDSKGVLGTSAASLGAGVQGEAYNTTGYASGVRGYSGSANGSGVDGIANSVTGENYGVHGSSQSPDGYGGYFKNETGGKALRTAEGGVQMDALSGTGTRMVVAGSNGTLSALALPESFSLPYSGTTASSALTLESTAGGSSVIVAYASAGTGDAAGVVGTTNAPSGSGLRGTALSGAGTAAGVEGASTASGGTGVYGIATHSTGVNNGVFGLSLSPQGSGGTFANLNTSGIALRTQQGNIKFDKLSGSGTRMVVAGADGTLSTQPTGLVLPYTVTTPGSGINITTDGPAANAFVGISSTGVAVYGRTHGATSAIQAIADIEGDFYSNGIYAENFSQQGAGITGVANADSGVAAGVSGETQSPNGSGGVFRNWSDGVALRTLQGTIRFDDLSGDGMRMVVADASGRLSAQPAGLVLPYTVTTAGSGINITTDGPAANAFAGISSTGVAVYGRTHGTTSAIQAIADIEGDVYSNGMYAENFSQQGAGIMGVANADSGVAAGVSGETQSPNGSGGLFRNWSDGVALRTLQGTIRFDNLSGTGNRMVVAGANGTLSTQEIPVGGSAGGTLNDAYDYPTPGSGSIIDADSGAVVIGGTDGLQVTGTYGSGAALNLNGAGSRMLFNPRKSAFRSGRVTGTQWNNTNVGDMSFASGWNTTASGLAATAMGYESTASGSGSTAIGSGTTAPSYQETAVGSYNTTYSPSGAATWVNTDRVFSVGNGNNASAKSNALTILKNGNSGFGATNETPTATVDIKGTFRLQGNGAAAGKFLSAIDANGNAAWVDAPAGGGNQWTTSPNGTHIYQANVSGGNVSIGSNNPSPDTKLSIYGGSQPNGLYVNASSNSDYAVKTTFGKINFGVNGATTEKVEVNGAIKIGDASSDGAANGTIRYTAANGFEGKHSNAWQPLNGTGGSGEGSGSASSLDAAYDNGGSGTGRTITADAGAVQIAGTDGLQVTGTMYSGANLALSGAGTKMFFYPKKAAFRAGNVDGTQWDNGNIGEFSAAMGRNAIASGSTAIALGGDVSAASESVAIGNFATASAGGVSIGTFTNASGLNALATGYSTNSTGSYATAMGYGNSSPSFGETVIGRYATTYTPLGGTGNWNTADRIFAIGNGTNDFSRSNALTVMKNGDLTIAGNAFKPGGGAFAATSDARLKKNVVDYKDGLAQLMGIHPVKYHYNEKSGNDTSKEHIGVIAQELQPIAPYMVSTFNRENTEYLQVDNSAMTYMLINAVKEQQRIIDEQKEALKALQNDNNTLKASINAQAVETDSLKKDMAALKSLLMPGDPTAAKN